MPTTQQDLSSLSVLGSRATPSRTLEVFPNHAPGLIVTLHCTEFTCVCPLTKQPDFASIEITYTADQFIVESKSLKLYLETYRNEGIFHEHLAADIGKDFIYFVKPSSACVKVMFHSRGGIAIDAEWRG